VHTLGEQVGHVLSNGTGCAFHSRFQAKIPHGYLEESLAKAKPVRNLGSRQIGGWVKARQPFHGVKTDSFSRWTGLSKDYPTSWITQPAVHPGKGPRMQNPCVGDFLVDPIMTQHRPQKM